MGKGQLGKGGGSDKYKSPNFKALMMIKKAILKSKQMTTTKLAELSIATRPTVQKKTNKKQIKNAVSDDHIVTM